MDRERSRNEMDPLLLKHWEKFNRESRERPTLQKYEFEYIAGLPYRARLLDVGCGRMDFSRKILRTRDDLKIDLFDGDISLKKEISLYSRWPGEVVGIGLFKDFEGMKIPRNKMYDSVFSRRALMFEKDDLLEVVKQLRLCMKDGATLYFDYLKPSKETESFFIKDGDTIRSIVMPLEADALRAILTEAGFKDKDIKITLENPYYEKPKIYAPTHIIVAKKEI